MFHNINPDTRILLCATPIDMRKSFNGLVGIVRNELEADPLAGHLFVFFNRTNTLVKILYTQAVFKFESLVPKSPATQDVCARPKATAHTGYGILGRRRLCDLV